MQPGTWAVNQRNVTRVDPAQLLPRRRWYAAAVAIGAVGVIAAAVTLVVGIRGFIAEFPDLGERFRSGETVTITVPADKPLVLYVSPDTAPFEGQCTADVPGAEVLITDTPYTFTFFSGWRTWASRYEIRSNRAGQGRLTCTQLSGARDPLLAVGDEPDNARLLRKLFGTIALGAGIAVLGLAIGGTLAAVVAKRRRAHRRRLQEHPVPAPQGR